MILSSERASKTLRRIFTLRWLFFHFIPVCLGVYLAIEGWVLANDREAEEARAYFTKLSEQIALSVQLASTITQMQPEALVALYFSADVPPKAQFQKFTTGNPFWDTAGTINGIQWAPYVLDRDRARFEADARGSYPDFFIWRFGPASSKIEQRNNSFNFYCPILHNPQGEFIVGLDLCNDLIEGPIIRRVASTGTIESAEPFELRMEGSGYPMGTVVYMPLFRNSQGEIQIKYTDDYIGSVISVIHFRSMLRSILQQMQLDDIDVFMFTSGAEPRYLAHFEGSLPDTNITYESVKDIRVSEILGDMVTPAEDAHLVDFADTDYMIIVRARKGKFMHRYRTNLPVVFLLTSLFVLFLDKIMMLGEKLVYRNEGADQVRKPSRVDPSPKDTDMNAVFPVECIHTNARILPLPPRQTDEYRTDNDSNRTLHQIDG